MKFRNIFSAILIAGTSCLVSCDKMMDKAMQAVMESAFNHDYQDSEKWGKVVTVDIPTLGFSEIELSGAVRLEYTQGSTYSVQVYGNEKAIEAYSIVSEDDELEASLKEGTGKVNKNTPAITLRITAPFITEIQAMGASEVIFKDSIAQDKELDLNISGAGKVNLGKLKTKELDMTISGAGEINMNDLCCIEDVELNMSGAANIDGKIDCRKLKVKMSGAGTGKLDIHCQQARVSASGAANITLSGECHDIASTAIGSSSVNKDSLKKRGEE
ncbi:MAG: DUF2807 domain-containing protein [Bacteroidaceae bacterium]|nr:DUF2807 domain-containing protein [Bacteroidaceae bacterium]